MTKIGKILDWTLIGLAELLLPAQVFPEAPLTPTNGVRVMPDASIISPCANGQVRIGSTSGGKYRCVSGSWVKEDIPSCANLVADPPSGACTGTPVCVGKTTGYFYFCNESNVWEQLATGGGGSGSPGGSNTQVQYNASGSFAGESTFTWNDGSDTLGATNISSTTGNFQNLVASSLFRLPQDSGTGGHNAGDMRWYSDIPYIYLGGGWRKIFTTLYEPVIMDDICLDDDEDGSACAVETDSSAKKITVLGSSSDSMQYKGSSFIYTKSGQTATVGFSNPPTGTRVLDFPDASGTIAVNGQAQNRVLLSGASYAISGDADLTFSGASNILSVGNVTDGAQILFGDTYLWRASDGELNIRHDGTNNSGLSIWAPLGDSDEAGINLSTDYDGTYSSYCHGMDIVSEDYDSTGWFGTDYEGLVLQRRCGRSKFNFEIRDWDGTSEAKRLNLDGNAALTVGSINLDATMDGTTDATLTTTAYSGNAATATTASGVAADSVALTTGTTGNYVASLATGGPLTGGAAGSEGATLTLGLTTGTGTDSSSTLTIHDLVSGTATSGQVPQWNGSNWVPATVSGASSNSFVTWDVPSGTDPAADSATDTMTIAVSGPITATGDSGADSITLGLTTGTGTDASSTLTLHDLISGTATSNQVPQWNGTNWVPATVSGSSSNSFATWDVSSGTDPVADSATDTIIITGTAPVVATGDSGADSVTISVSDATTGAKGVVQLAGDLGGTATAPTIAANAVTLGTDTTGNYVASVGTSGPLSGGAAGSEGAAISLSLTTGTGTDSSSTLTLHDFISGTASSGQVPQWNGSNWVPATASSSTRTLWHLTLLDPASTVDLLICDDTNSTCLIGPVMPASVTVSEIKCVLDPGSGDGYTANITVYECEFTGGTTWDCDDVSGAMAVTISSVGSTPSTGTVTNGTIESGHYLALDINSVSNSAAKQLTCDVGGS